MTLKAWKVHSDEWGMVVYHETRGKAKVFCIRELLGTDDFVDNLVELGCKRAPTMDQFTGEKPAVEYDNERYLIGGIPVLCASCETLVEPNDPYQKHGDYVLCERCMRKAVA